MSCNMLTIDNTYFRLNSSWCGWLHSSQICGSLYFKARLLVLADLPFAVNSSFVNISYSSFKTFEKTSYNSLDISLNLALVLGWIPNICNKWVWIRGREIYVFQNFSPFRCRHSEDLLSRIDSDASLNISSSPSTHEKNRLSTFESTSILDPLLAESNTDVLEWQQKISSISLSFLKATLDFSLFLFSCNLSRSNAQQMICEK